MRVQGPIAEEMMKLAMDRGLWVFFQNCHLAPSWMPSLERLIEQIDPERVSDNRSRVLDETDQTTSVVNN